MTDTERISEIRKLLSEYFSKKTLVTHEVVCAIRKIVNKEDEDNRPALWPMIHREYKIEFDGGTPCNDPSKGYGIGYGSYRINEGKPIRLNFGRPMSANAAEIFTLIEAIRYVGHMEPNRSIVSLNIFGDSQIALNWARGSTPSGKPKKMGRGTSDEFKFAVKTLRDCIKGFGHITCTWHSRVNSVAAFGH